MKKENVVENPVMLDKIGQEIKVGSIIAYGHALGRCAALQLGKVLAIKVTMKPGHRWIPGKRESESCDVPEYRITVRGITEQSSWQNNYTEEWVLLRKGTLQFPDRTIVLDPALIPQPMKDMLDKAE